MNNNYDFYVTRHFVIQELVPPEVFQKFGNKAFMFLDTKILIVIDYLRDFFDVPIVCNDYHLGGKLSRRGLRIDNEVGASFSQHKFGRAVDLNFKGIDSNKVREEIIKRIKEYPFCLIKGIETDISWVHLDCRNTEKIEIFKP